MIINALIKKNMLSNDLRDYNYIFDINNIKDSTRKRQIIDMDESIFNATNIVFHIQKNENYFFD